LQKYVSQCLRNKANANPAVTQKKTRKLTDENEIAQLKNDLAVEQKK